MRRQVFEDLNQMVLLQFIFVIEFEDINDRSMLVGYILHVEDVVVKVIQIERKSNKPSIILPDEVRVLLLLH